jgi:hypothetical protein
MLEKTYSLIRTRYEIIVHSIKQTIKQVVSDQIECYLSCLSITFTARGPTKFKLLVGRSDWLPLREYRASIFIRNHKQHEWSNHVHLTIIRSKLKTSNTNIEDLSVIIVKWSLKIPVRYRENYQCEIAVIRSHPYEPLIPIVTFAPQFLNSTGSSAPMSQHTESQTMWEWQFEWHIDQTH